MAAVYESCRVAVEKIHELGDSAKDDHYPDAAPSGGTDAEIFALLSPSLRRKTRAFGITAFFPMQRFILPTAIKEGREKLGIGRDVCVSAPTGSGKTLIYALTMLEGLSDRRVPRLRGVVVVPSRELARQVHEVLEALLPDMEDIPLRCCLCAGQPGEKVFVEPDWDLIPPSARPKTPAGQFSMWDLEKCLDPLLVPEHLKEAMPAGGAPHGPDVIVATPGRLVAHIDSTRGFTLQHARFVIIDEADRLLAQSYDNWAPKLLEAVHANVAGSCEVTEDFRPFDATTRRPTDMNDRDAPHPWFRTRLVKHLYSATLGDDPAQLASMHLSRPLFVDVDAAGTPRFLDGESAERFFRTADAAPDRTLPPNLRESTVSCDAASKPVVLLALLERERAAAAALVIVFANSVDTATRLAKLLGSWAARRHWTRGADAILALSSAASAGARDKVLAECRRRGRATGGDALTVLVASDVLARGVDLAAASLVVNYDAPRDASNYVHRVGRCARAGRAGLALSLITQSDLAYLAAIEGCLGARLAKCARFTERSLPLQPVARAMEQVSSLKRDRPG